MAQAGTPVVRDGYLHLPNRRRLRLGSAAWFAWLQTASRFSYHAPDSSRLTVRKEQRRHGHYWYADLKHDGKLHNAYAGRSTALTPERLAVLAQQLQQKRRR